MSFLSFCPPQKLRLYLGVTCLAISLLHSGTALGLWSRHDKCDLSQNLLAFTEKIAKHGYQLGDFKKCDWGKTEEDAADQIFQAFDVQSNDNQKNATRIKSKFCTLFKTKPHLISFFSKDQKARIALKCGLRN